jgi:beta-lactamase class A
MNLKKAMIVETIIIILLLMFIGSQMSKNAWAGKQQEKYKFISPRISKGVLEPKSYLIFNFKPLELDIRNYIAEQKKEDPAQEIGVYVENMRDGASFGILANEGFEPASLNKLPIAIIIMKNIEQGKFTLATKLPITDDDRDTRTGVLYKTTLQEMAIQDLIELMLVESDNTAFRVLARQVTLQDLRDISRYLDYYNETVDTEYPIQNDYAVTPRSTSHLFLSLYLSTILQPEHSEYLLSLLAHTTFDINKEAHIPPEVVVAQKYGSYYVGTEQFFHSCGIMYLDETRIFYCVMTKDIEKDKATEIIGGIVHRIYTYTVQTRDELQKDNPLSEE